ALDDLQPFLAVVVAAVVVAERDAEHPELDRIPPGDDVEAEAAMTDVIGGHHLLGGKYRVDKCDMKRAEGRDLPRRRQQPACPGQRLERRSLRIAFALISMPAPDRQQELEAGLIGKPGRRDVVVPGGVPALRRLGEAGPAGAVHPEQPKLELVPVVDARLVPAAGHMLPHSYPTSTCRARRLCPCGALEQPRQIAHAVISRWRVTMWKSVLTLVIS